MVLSGARPKGARQATGRGPGSADADPHDAYRHFDGWASCRGVSIPEMNTGVETCWFQGYGTDKTDWTDFLSGSAFPVDQLTTKQRFVGIGPTCETNGIQWLQPGSQGWMNRELGLNNPERGVMVGEVGQMNGRDWEHRHELAMEVTAREFQNHPAGEWMATTVWRINWYLSQYGEGRYARGNTLFANGLIRSPNGLWSVADVPAPAGPGPEREMWSVPFTGSGSGFDIHFDLPRNASVSLDVYNVAGRHIITLMDGRAVQGGENRWSWYNRDAQGQKVPSGIYLAKLVVTDKTGCPFGSAAQGGLSRGARARPRRGSGGRE